MNDGAIKSSMRHLSMLGAWALAFGCAVGSDAFVMPWNDFLPKAGPLGTVIGIFIGGLVMAVVAWNFHYMINRQPGPGGDRAVRMHTRRRRLATTMDICVASFSALPTLRSSVLT